MGYESPAYAKLFTEMLLGAQRGGERGQPRPSERNSAHSRRLRNEGLDRDLCIQRLEEFRAQYEMQTSALHYSLTTSIVEVSPTPSAPLQSLKAITLSQLIVGKRHYGRVLHGRLCAKPFKMSAIVSVLEDDAGNGVRLTIYNVLPETASPKEVEARFPSGMRVIVKEPFFKICADGKTAVRVDNPADIALDETWKKETSPPDLCDDSSVTVELEAIRCEGNELFGEQNWIGAVDKYSECIDLAISKMGKNINKTTWKKFNRIVLLAYSNRAEARLRLGAYEDAWSDADKAIEFDTKHVKTLVRKAKAAHGLGLFDKSRTIFKAALDISPQEDSIVENLKASNIAYEQSTTGNYDLSGFYSSGCTSNAPPCADFVGPVEIRRVHRGYGRRGLFAKKKVEPGQVLLVSNPLAILRQKSHLNRVNVNLRFQKRVASNGVINSGIQQDFIGELTNRVMKSKRKMAQLYSLAGYGKLEMDIPSMELFRPGSEWVPPGAETLEVDMGLISDIANMNSFGSNNDNIHELGNRIDKGDSSAKDGYSGIWVLPSFANHSCAPNCLLAFVGDTVFFRASVNILEGEEITIPYFRALFDGVETRQAMSKSWFFTCKCERCVLEESLKPQLSKLTKAIPNLVKAAEAESREEGQKRRAAKELAKVADEIEAVIQSRETKLGSRQQCWIRASFVSAYFAKFKLAMDEHDSRSRITTLRTVVDSMASVIATPEVLKLAAILLRDVEQRYCKHSQSHRLTQDRVLGIYRIAFGKLPNSILHKLIRAHWAPLSLEDWINSGSCS